IIKDIFKGKLVVHQLTAGSMQHTFWLTGRTGGVENKQRIFGVHLFRLVLIARLLNQVVPPQVAPFLPVNFPASTLQYHHMLYAGDVRVFQRVINVFLQRNTAPARTPSSEVITSRELESIMRPATASGEKPPKITECTAPMRAQASIATAASGTIGI